MFKNPTPQNGKVSLCGAPKVPDLDHSPYCKVHQPDNSWADDQPQEEGWCISAILGIAKWAPPSGVPFARSWCQTLDCTLLE